MNKTFSYDDSTQLAPHFNIREFRCKCGKKHSTQLDTSLVEMLERLYSSLNCSKIIINSGYRCESHDKNVGGNGYGQHTKGTAADIKCYDVNGNIISSKVITCAAQDTGFYGIANIDGSYTSCHVDIRTGTKWFGDETITSAYSVTDNFYKHWGLTKNDVYNTAPLPCPTPEKNTVSVTLSIDGTNYRGILTEIIP